MRVLIVEDSRLISKVLSKKIEDTTQLSVDIAKSLDEAKSYLEKNSYILALLDLHLPGSDPKDVVEFFIQKHDIPSILMTSSTDKELKEEVYQRKIIDYVIKNRSESIDYIVHLVDRLIKNKNHVALVVDDSRVYQKEISQILNKHLIRTVVANDGEEAIQIMRNNKDISIAIIDYEMPRYNGLELVLSIRKSYKKYELPIIGVSIKKENAIVFLKHGVNDFLRKPFFKEELQTRVNNTLDSIENVQKLNNYANTDFLTGVANRKYFSSHAEEYFVQSHQSQEPFAVAMFDIDHFKKINDTYGHDVGDEVIKTLALTIKDNIKGQDIVARFGGEEFCVLLKNIEPNAAHSFFESLRKKIESLKMSIYGEEVFGFTVSIGLATKREKTLKQMITKSDQCLYEAKNNGRNMVCSDLRCELNLKCEAV